MALRVLLADESSTIKKVMQLALQDFQVEVKAVPIGLDVLQVAKSFNPDIIFADVLLSKRNGYDVSAEIKGDAVLKKTPVVLMWSGFMELDEAKAKSSGAERRLEKPFDADHLRSLVKDLVPRLSENKISNYLSFPDLPDIVETPQEGIDSDGATPPPPVAEFEAPEGLFSEPAPKAAASAPKAPAPKAPPAPAQARPAAPKVPPPPPPPQARPPAQVPGDGFQFDSLDRDLEDPDEFQQVPLPGSKTKNTFEQRETEDWRTTALEQFRVAPDSLPADAFDKADGMISVDDAEIAMTDGVENISLDELEDLTVPGRKTPPPAPVARAVRSTRETPVSTASLGTLDPMRAEEVLREQVREVLESIAWKIIPDIAERVVREEIQKLLKEAERLS